ncbi:MAG: hypothetical protein NZM43_13195 [Saprospiraceae bacterium]|nr:hypothetical protein [Saprospiraceae bacterium]MDW8485270.1 hypothetical protein [Saprospiraceae bacterium]
MKEKRLSRRALALLGLLSCFSALYVNIDAAKERGQPISSPTVETVMPPNDERGQEPEPLPGVKWINRVIDLAHRLISNAPKRY